MVYFLAGREIEAAIFLLLYFIPTGVGLVRWLAVRGDPTVEIPIGQVIMLNLLLGWTVVGWIAALVVAGRSLDVLPLAAKIPQPGTAGQPDDLRFIKPIWDDNPNTTQQEQPIWDTSFERGQAEQPAWTAAQPQEDTKPPCYKCNDQGGEVCPSCLGARGTWVVPQGENGTSTWVQCGRCLGSGRVQCTGCGKY